jgi:hypothetical protein
MTMIPINFRRGMVAWVFVLAAYPGLSQGAEQKRLGPSTRIAAILVQAERALAEDRLTLPAGNNAVAYAQEVLDLAPGDPEAQGILRAVVTHYGLIAGAALERDEALRRQEEAGRRHFRLQEPTGSRCECFYARRRSYCRCDVCRQVATLKDKAPRVAGR